MIASYVPDGNPVLTFLFFAAFLVVCDLIARRLGRRREERFWRNVDIGRARDKHPSSGLDS